LEKKLHRPLDRKQLLIEAEKDVALRNEGLVAEIEGTLLAELQKSFGTEQKYLLELNNYFSSSDRLKYLKALIPRGLKIFGHFQAGPGSLKVGCRNLAKALSTETSPIPRNL